MKKTTPKKIDATDMQIIRLLQKDSRLSFNKIAGKIGISVGTAYNRIKNLEVTGVVKGYGTTLDTAKLGYELTAIILIQAAGKYLAEVEEEVAKLNAVTAAYDVAGDFDVALVTKFKDRQGLNDFVKGLLANPHIKRTVTNVALNVVKEDQLVIGDECETRTKSEKTVGG